MHFDPDNPRGWVVRRTRTTDVGTHSTWWYGPNHGFGTTSGPLDFSAVVWPTRTAAEKAMTAQYGYPWPKGTRIERVTDAVKFAIAEAHRRIADVLESDRKDKQEIADANVERIAYLSGRVSG